MNTSPESSQLQWRRASSSRGLSVLASIGILGLLSSAQVANAGDNDLEHFNDLDGAFVMANGEVRRSEHEGTYTEDRHYLTSARSDYLSSDWSYEVTVRSPSDGPPDILFIGIGSGRPDPTYFNEPANSLMFRIHQGWVGGRVDVAAHPTGPEFTYFAEAIGALPAHSGKDFTEFTARIAKVGNTIEFSICKCPSDAEPCEPEFFDEIPDVSAAAPFLSSGNTYLFLGNGSGSYVFTKAAISAGSVIDTINGSASGTAAASGSATALGSERSVDSGGGSIDALFVAVLAQLAVAGALRRRHQGAFTSATVPSARFATRTRPFIVSPSIHPASVTAAGPRASHRRILRKSVLIARMTRRDAHGKPPLGSAQVDTEGAALLTSWVNSLTNRN